MLTRAGWIASLVLLLAVRVHAQQQVHGQLPADVFAIDPNKVASWNDKVFDGSSIDFPVKKFEAATLERWSHEFPAHYAAVSDKSVDTESVELKQWESPKSVKPEFQKQIDSPRAELASKSRSSDSLVVNEKWSRSATKGRAEQKAEEASAFIVQATIRPLEVPEVQEKLNEYSSPPGERQKKLPSPLQKSSKF